MGVWSGCVCLVFVEMCVCVGKRVFDSWITCVCVRVEIGMEWQELDCILGLAGFGLSCFVGI